MGMERENAPRGHLSRQMCWAWLLWVVLWIPTGTGTSCLGGL